MASQFLSPEDVFELTGFERKSKQIEFLRKKAIPFFVNGRGYPKVPVTVVNGGDTSKTPKKGWSPPAQ